MERTFAPSKLPLPMGDLDPHLIHGSLGPPVSSTQTASRSLQPFLHGSLVWQTDWQTHRPHYSVGNNRPHLRTLYGRCGLTTTTNIFQPLSYTEDTVVLMVLTIRRLYPLAHKYWKFMVLQVSCSQHKTRLTVMTDAEIRKYMYCQISDMLYSWKSANTNLTKHRASTSMLCYVAIATQPVPRL